MRLWRAYVSALAYPSECCTLSSIADDAANTAEVREETPPHFFGMIVITPKKWGGGVEPSGCAR